MQYIHKVKIKEKLFYFLIFLTLIFSSGCFHEFYLAKTHDLDTFQEQPETHTPQKYYVLHHQGKAMHLDETSIQEEKIAGLLSELPAERVLQLQKEKKFLSTHKSLVGIRYRPSEKYVLHDVHIYLHDDTPLLLQTGPVTIPASAIKEVQVYGKDQQTTNLSHWGPVVVILISIPIAVAAVTGNLDVWR